MSLPLHAWILVLCLFLTLPVQAANEPVGQVVLILGTPWVARGEREQMLTPEDSLHEEDRLVIPEGSRLLLKLRDDTTIWLGENSELELSHYRVESDKPSITLKFLKGALRCITGLIGKQPSADFTVETSTALIGIRGTEFWAGYIFEGDLGVAMIGGKGVYVENSLGRVALTQASQGTTVVPGQAPSAPIIWQPEKIQRALEATHIPGG
ncbi:MAG: FecR domain-containing protein [Oceanospirillales bacterium]|nr:FecR domain-containing protein [Oceanospirillales bacterium]